LCRVAFITKHCESELYKIDQIANFRCKDIIWNCQCTHSRYWDYVPNMGHIIETKLLTKHGKVKLSLKWINLLYFILISKYSVSSHVKKISKFRETFYSQKIAHSSFCWSHGSTCSIRREQIYDLVFLSSIT